jgi:2'-5' RNA ligase
MAAEYEPEKRAFTPHLTVARFRDQVPLPPEVLAVEVEGDPFEVAELVLYRSYLQRPHARYEPIERFPLGG